MLESLESASVFKFFQEIANIPHGSGDEKQISDYLVKFAQENDLDYKRDEYNNILIKKQGSKGYENAPSIILQAHIDMVCVKTYDSNHDFLKDPLKLVIDKDKNIIYAKDTSLGADDGIGAAIILALIKTKNIGHPNIEALFTVDEERSMLGARTFDTSQLKSKILFNLDGEDENCFTAGSGGGLGTEITYDADYINIKDQKDNFDLYELKIDGLLGGHSAVEINKEHANAIILVTRILNELNKKIDLNLCDIGGGTAGNVIPSSCAAILNIKSQDLELAKEILDKTKKDLELEFKYSDPALKIDFVKSKQNYDLVISKEALKKLIGTIFLIPNGLINRNLNLNGASDTSNNIGVIEIKNNKIIITDFARSSLESRLDFIFDKLELIVKKFDGEIKISNRFPAWDYNPDSKLISFCKKNYESVYGKSPVIDATHGGLECSFFKQIPDVEIISMGPNVFNCHSVNEKVEIDSVDRFWRFFKNTIQELKNY